MSFRLKDLLRLVDREGESLVLSKTTTKGVYNASTGRVESSISADFPFVGYFYNQMVGTGDLSSHQYGNRMCVIPNVNLTVSPNDNDSITSSDGEYQITNVKVIDSRGSPVCYLCSIST